MYIRFRDIVMVKGSSLTSFTAKDHKDVKVKMEKEVIIFSWETEGVAHECICPLTNVSFIYTQTETKKQSK